MPVRKKLRNSKPGKRSVTVKRGLSRKDGAQAVIRKAMRQYGGDYRGVSCDPKTGRGSVV